jgi:beta-glucosidase
MRQPRPHPDREGMGRCAGARQEKVYDVAWSDERKPGWTAYDARRDTGPRTPMNERMRARFATALSAVVVAAFELWSGLASAQSSPDSSEQAFVATLLGRMTLEEKLGQLNQADGRPSPKAPTVSRVSEDAIRRGSVGSYLGVSGAANTRRLQRIAVEESRLGIPLLFADDVIHGFRTIFPVPLAEAASFDVDAVERAARISAREATAYGLHWTFAPMVDIARDPRWGRIVEGAGEDPYLGAAMAVARVRGFQGRGPASNDSLLATVKHFAAYGAAEGGRDYNTADISERTLREIYLPPFKAAIDAGAGSVMVAFNEIAGVPMHANRELLRGVLREDWGFGGIVVSDYGALLELIEHKVASDRGAAGRLALDAGVDIDMESEVYLQDLAAVVRSGRLSERSVDEAVTRILRAKYRLGLFNDPYRYCDPERERTRVLTAEHRTAARKTAAKSLVLLKNDKAALPLPRSIRTLAVIGPLATDARSMLGSWSADGREEDAVTPLNAIRSAVEPSTRVLYARGVTGVGSHSDEIAAAQRIARQADAVLLFLGESHLMTGEARSRTSLDLPGEQEALARAVKATGKPLNVVLFAGRPLSIEWLASNASSILLAWFPGTEGGHAIADAVFGNYNPAGRLPVTFPRNVGQVPIYYNHKNTGRPADPAVENSSKYLDAPWTPLYPFGHGLSYTAFRYDGLRVDRQQIVVDEKVTVRVDVQNVGDRAGEEVAQLYMRDHVASTTRPVSELRGFKRVHLRPGERTTVSFELGPAELGVLGPDLRRRVEPGTFSLFVGGSSTASLEIRLEVVARE